MLALLSLFVNNNLRRFAHCRHRSHKGHIQPAWTRHYQGRGEPRRGDRKRHRKRCKHCDADPCSLSLRLLPWLGILPQERSSSLSFLQACFATISNPEWTKFPTNQASMLLIPGPPSSESSTLRSEAGIPGIRFCGRNVKTIKKKPCALARGFVLSVHFALHYYAAVRSGSACLSAGIT